MKPPSNRTHLATMRVIAMIGGVVGLGLGILLCMPAAATAWQGIFSHYRARNTNFADLVSSSPLHHSDFILSVGSLTLSGWRMWAFLCSLADIGALFIMAGVYVLFSRLSEN